MWVFELIVLLLIIAGLVLMFIFKYSFGTSTYQLSGVTTCIDGKATNIYTCYSDSPCRLGFWDVSYATLFQEISCTNPPTSRSFRDDKIPCGKVITLKNGYTIEREIKGWKLNGQQASLESVRSAFNAPRQKIEQIKVKPVENYIHLLTTICEPKELFENGNYQIEKEDKILSGTCQYVDEEMTYFILGQDSRVYSGRDSKVILARTLPGEELSARAALFFKTSKGYYVFLEDLTQGWLASDLSLSKSPNYFFLDNFDDLILEKFTGTSFYQGPLRQALFRDFKKKLPF